MTKNKVIEFLKTVSVLHYHLLISFSMVKEIATNFFAILFNRNMCIENPVS